MTTPNIMREIWCPSVVLQDWTRPHHANNRGRHTSERGAADVPIDGAACCVHRRCAAWAWVDDQATGDDDLGWCRKYGEPPYPQVSRVAAAVATPGDDLGYVPAGPTVPYPNMTARELHGWTYAGGVLTLASGNPTLAFDLIIAANLSVGQLSASDTVTAHLLIDGTVLPDFDATWTTGSGSHSSGSGSPGALVGVAMGVQDGATLALSFSGDPLDLRTVTLQAYGVPV